MCTKSRSYFSAYHVGVCELSSDARGWCWDFTAQHVASPPFAIQMSMYEASSKLKQPSSPLCLIGSNHSLHLQVNSTISYWLPRWKKRAVSASVSEKRLKHHHRRRIFPGGHLGSVVVCFVYSLAPGTGVECCIIVCGVTLMIPVKMPRCVCVCVSCACFWPSWMLFDLPCFCSFVRVSHTHT